MSKGRQKPNYSDPLELNEAMRKFVEDCQNELEFSRMNAQRAHEFFCSVSQRHQHLQILHTVRAQGYYQLLTRLEKVKQHVKSEMSEEWPVINHRMSKSILSNYTKSEILQAHKKADVYRQGAQEVISTHTHKKTTTTNIYTHKHHTQIRPSMTLQDLCCEPTWTDFLLCPSLCAERKVILLLPCPYALTS